jgi:hypothetical protein
MRQIEDWKLYYEIGHGIIAHIFNGCIYNFNGITFDRDEVREAKRHPDDEGYTKLRTIQDFREVVFANLHSTGLVDGLHLLSGSAGATFLYSNDSFSEMVIVPTKIESQINIKAAQGDFDLITESRSPYGILLNENGADPITKRKYHSKLYQILLELFVRHEIRNGASVLFKILKATERLNQQDFKDAFNDKLTSLLKSELLHKLSETEFRIIS